MTKAASHSIRRSTRLSSGPSATRLPRTKSPKSQEAITSDTKKSTIYHATLIQAVKETRSHEKKPHSSQKTYLLSTSRLTQARTQDLCRIYTYPIVVIRMIRLNWSGSFGIYKSQPGFRLYVYTKVPLASSYLEEVGDLSGLVRLCRGLGW